MSVLTHTIRSASLHGYINLAQLLGLNPAQLLADVGIERSSLDFGDTPISVTSACELLERSALMSGVETFGLQMAARRRLSNFGLLGLVLREEPTGLAMLESLCRYLTLTNNTLSTEIEQRPDYLTIREDLLFAPSHNKTQSIELTVGVMARLLFDIMGDRWAPHSVCFQHAAPRQLDFHRQFFKSPLKFNAPFNGIVCKTIDFERQLPNTDSSSVQLLRKSLDQALISQQKTATELILALITVLLPTGRCRLAHIAKHFGVTQRTIHRQLTSENVQFSQLVNQVRKQVVARHLNNTICNLTELSELLGFASASVFSHWFQVEYGTSATQWRKQSHSLASHSKPA